MESLTLGAKTASKGWDDFAWNTCVNMYQNEYNWREQPKAACGGADVGTFTPTGSTRASSITECKNACKDNGACFRFTFLESDYTCHLKGQAEEKTAIYSAWDVEG